MYQQQRPPFNRPRAMPFRPRHAAHTMRGSNMPPMNSYQVGRFPLPTHFTDNRESPISVRVQGSRIEDHHQPNQMTQIPRQQGVDLRMCGDGQGQRSKMGYSNNSNLISLSEDQPYQRQGLDWSEYQTPNNVFAPNEQQQQQQQQHPQQVSYSHVNPNTGPSATGMQSWNAPAHCPPQARDQQGLYVPESAGSILASFGLSNEDLEFLSHYPDEQLTPDTLPFILRDIRIKKTSRPTDPPPAFSDNILPRSDLPPTPRLSPPQQQEIPSFLSVAQISGKVIDYGHASRAAEEGRETIKHEPLSQESSTKPEYKTRKPESPDRPRLNDSAPYTHKYRDSKDHKRLVRSPGAPKRKRTPVREPPSRSLLEHNVPRMKPPSEARSDSMKSTPRSESKSSPRAPRRLPTPSMISDYLAHPPKLYPHTCCLCDTQCERDKEWKYHVNTVKHTASCRDLRNKFPGWKPDLPRKVQDDSATWRSVDRSPSRSISRSLSCSPSPPPGQRKRTSPCGGRRTPHGRAHGPHPSGSRRGSSGLSTGSSRKRSRDDTTKHTTGSSYSSSHGRSSTSKSGNQPVPKVSKPRDKHLAAGKDTEKVSNPKLQRKSSPGSYLLYLTGLPADCKYQEVVSMLQAFGKVDNVLILKPKPKEKQSLPLHANATVWMLNEQDTQALAACHTLSIRGLPITVSDKKPEDPCTSSIPVVIKGNTNSTIKSPETNSKEKINKRAVVKVSGLPKSSCLDLEGEIGKLAQPFGTPVKILLITEPNEAFVTMPDRVSAQNMVNRYDKTPALINDSVVKMTLLPPKLEPNLNRPVALFRSLMGPRDPKTAGDDDWKRLLVVRNVPQTPSAPAEVHALIKRFGEVQQTLALKGMVIFEMETADVAQEVFKHFLTFPCTVQKKTLSFTWKPDPMPGLKTSAPPTDGQEDFESVEVESGVEEEVEGDGEARETEGGEVETELQEVGDMAAERGVEKDGLLGGNVEERDESLLQSEVTDPSVGQHGADTQDTVINTSTGEANENKKMVNVDSTAATQSSKMDIVKVSESPATSPSPEVMLALLEALRKQNRNRSSSNAKLSTEKAPAETPTAKESTGKQTSDAQPPLALAAVTPDILKALLDECRARSSSRANTEQAKKGDQKVDGRRDPGREQVAKRKFHDHEERERERRQRERRRKVQQEKEDNERRERRHSHREGSSGSAKSRSSMRSEGSRPIGRSGRSPRSESRRGYREGRHSPVRKSSQQQVHDKLELDEELIPIDMEEFVTLDEVEDLSEVTAKAGVEFKAIELTVHDATATSAGQQAPAATPPPEAGQQAPEAVLPPEAGQQAPEAALPPEAGQQAPEAMIPIEAGQQAPAATPPPEAGQQAPEAALPPEAGQQAPEAMIPPEAGQQAPAATPPPEAGQQAPEATIPPEAGQQAPEATIPPEAGQQAPEATIPPEAGQQAPEATIPPEAGQQAPEATLPPEAGQQAPAATPAPEAEHQAPEGTTPVEVDSDPGTAEVPVYLVKREQEDEQDEEMETSLATTEEGSIKTGTTDERLMKIEEGTVEVKVENVLEHQGDTNMLLASVLKPTSRELTEVSEAHDDAAPTDPATVCIKQEEDESYGAVELKDKMKTQEESEEAVRKKMRLEPLFPEDYTVPSFCPDRPVGMEFLVPKSGFFCKVCSKFYSGTDEAKKNHCKTIKHYQNLEKSLEKWRASKGP